MSFCFSFRKSWHDSIEMKISNLLVGMPKLKVNPHDFASHVKLNLSSHQQIRTYLLCTGWIKLNPLIRNLSHSSISFSNPSRSSPLICEYNEYLLILGTRIKIFIELIILMKRALSNYIFKNLSLIILISFVTLVDTYTKCLSSRFY